MAVETKSAECWLHGNAGHMQSAQAFHTERLGFYLRAKAYEPCEGWVHYSPTTPWLGPGSKLQAVVIVYRTYGAAMIDGLHVWDGPRLLLERDELGATTEDLEPGTEPDDELPRLTMEFTKPRAYRHGIGVSLLIVARKPLDALAIGGVGLLLEHDNGSI